MTDVEQNIEEFWSVLDNGFFKVRYERCSASDKKFIFAMVQCGELPCTISNVAKIMGKISHIDFHSEGTADQQRDYFIRVRYKES